MHRHWKKELVKQQYLLHMSSQYELRPIREREFFAMTPCM